MGLRLDMRVYQGMDAAAFRHLIEQAASSLGGQLIWLDATVRGQDIRYHLGERVHTLTVPYEPGMEEFSERVGELTEKSWLRLRIQEGTLWDYELVDSSGSQSLDTFSVCPEYWNYPEVDPAHVAEWKGKPDVLAKAFDVPLETIEHYLVHWGYQDNGEDECYTYVRQGKAYPDDESGYGECYQVFDFLRRLGGSEPVECATLKLPLM